MKNAANISILHQLATHEIAGHWTHIILVAAVCIECNFTVVACVILWIVCTRAHTVAVSNGKRACMLCIKQEFYVMRICACTEPFHTRRDKCCTHFFLSGGYAVAASSVLARARHYIPTFSEYAVARALNEIEIGVASAAGSPILFIKRATQRPFLASVDHFVRKSLPVQGASRNAFGECEWNRTKSQSKWSHCRTLSWLESIFYITRYNDSHE